MAPSKRKTAFQFFQAENIGRIKNELGAGASMGSAMTELSTRWKSLDEIKRRPYAMKEEEDLRRFQHGAAIADARAATEQREKRKQLIAQDGEDVSMRGERSRVAMKRAEKEEGRRKRKLSREASTDPDELERRRQVRTQKKAETLERHRIKEQEGRLLEERHKKLQQENKRDSSKRLKYLLKQSSIFAKLKKGHGGAKDDEDKNGSNPGDSNYTPHHRGEKIAGKKDQEDDEEEEIESSEDHMFLSQQPDCIVGGTLKPYQLEGLNWMIHLAEKGLNGILADEMGLGKTLQSISILAYLYEYQNIQGPHLICVPKSTLSNWMNELKRWCPSLRVIKFHGSKEKRSELAHAYFTNEAASCSGFRPQKQMKCRETDELIDDNSDNPCAWDVCVTTYEVCNTERQVLSKFAWKYLIIDEAHRLKNEASIFSKTVRTYNTSHRLLLTGTPLQNNLHELWALLNFLLPDIFSSSDQFDEWFDLEIDDEQAKKDMISQLHKILRPFMLRRLKADVAKGLPPKTETLIMVGMSTIQKRLYKKLLLRDIDSITSTSSKNKTAILNIVMQLRKCCGHPYLFEGVEDRTLDPLGEHLVQNCGKLFMVDKLLKKLKERGSRVLIFTQMTRILDILEDYMVMRGFKYCRIDGNTDYDVRESSIDAFNAPNSEKFCFILSTRAGGLGINLQTADTCILYDSDWNPQADLQAQDRCHRLGQTKPVSVYRLVSENSVEEKIVERAQQKLKLDAMVVQQGRLKDKDKVAKEEIMAAVRFGADTVFRSEESTITDEDVDIILERGKAKTKELQEKIQKADKGDLLDFRLDGGISAQTFEGIDYSDKDLRTQLKLLAADSMGKRERRPPPINYNPIVQPKKSMIVNNRKIKLPKVLRLPPMEDHQFYNRERLLELSKLEFQTYATLKEAGQLPHRELIETQRTILPDELAIEKLELLEEGFGDWTRSQYWHFIKAAIKFGRDDFISISADMEVPPEIIEAYSKAFWTYGDTELKEDEWERVVSNIEKGEARIAKKRKLSGLLKKFINTFTDPRNEMTFANKGTAHFTLEQDRAMLCAVDKHGYGNWDKVREDLRQDDALMFQHTVQAMNTDAIAKRCDYRMRQMERELEAREKKVKSLKPLNVIAAEKSIKAIKEMESCDTEICKLQMRGEDIPSLENLSSEARQITQDRLNDRQQIIEKFREIEIQLRGCRELAKLTKQAILRGDQYVNYSHITLKAGGLYMTADGALDGINGMDLEAYINPVALSTKECGECDKCLHTKPLKLCVKRQEVRNKLIAEYESKLKKIRSKMKRESCNSDKTGEKDKETNHSSRKRVRDDTVAKKDKVVSKKRLFSPGNPLGNKRMSVPDDLLPHFCLLIGASGTRKRMHTIETFAKENPSVSIRQATFKFAEITTRHLPECIPEPEKPKGKGRAFCFFLRPRLYHLLPKSDRPTEWEKYAREDNLKWEGECKKKEEEKAKKERHMKEMMGGTGTKSQILEDNLNSSMDVSTTNFDLVSVKVLDE